jgi:hypothetical protein
MNPRVLGGSNNFLDSKNGFVLDSPQFKGTRFLFIPEFE